MTKRKKSTRPDPLAGRSSRARDAAIGRALTAAPPGSIVVVHAARCATGKRRGCSCAALSLVVGARA